MKTILLLLMCLCAYGEVVVVWDKPEEIPSGYTIYLGGKSGKYSQTIDAGLTWRFALDGLVKGAKYYSAITAYNEFGESPLSNEISFIVKGGPQIVSLTKTGENISFVVENVEGTYTLESSEDLRTWKEVVQFSTSNFSILEESTKQFYRIKCR